MTNEARDLIEKFKKCAAQHGVQVTEIYEPAPGQGFHVETKYGGFYFDNSSLSAIRLNDQYEPVDGTKSFKQATPAEQRTIEILEKCARNAGFELKP
ncbi:MAG: hypothetical protein FWF24_04185 [Alphaproteobacteria bacterium]|nr:hypothetical protein [Alphaproteobacteria bacterium]